MVAPVLLKYRVCKPRLLLAGSRAEVDTAADVALLVGEVLLIEDSARQYHRIGGNINYILTFFPLSRSVQNFQKSKPDSKNPTST